MADVGWAVVATAMRIHAAFRNMPQISVVIVNYNSGAFVAAAVLSAIAQTPPPLEIIVVDSKSTDHSLATLAGAVSDPRLCVIKLDQNLGFAAACNVGIRAASGELILLLNPDCRMLPGSLGELAAALETDAAIGAVGPRLINPDGSEQRGGRRDIPTPWLIFCYVTRLYRLAPEHPRFRSFNTLHQPLPNAPIDVQAISGACMLVRRETIDDCGLLDADRFFLHFEDLDWCLRFTQAGRRVVFVPNAIVEHTKGVCSASRPVRVELYKHASLVRFLRKHFTRFYPSSFMLTVQALVLVSALVSAIRVLFKRPLVGGPSAGLVEELEGLEHPIRPERQDR